jgi:diketogulonate reductase-like aldo/keto reductase
LDKFLTLNNGVKIPRLGLGVWQMNDDEAENAVKIALENGYLMIDTAEGYKNEAAVGRGIKASGVPRDQFFITTKVNNSSQGYEETKAAFAASLEKLQLDYLDLYLVHWPMPETFVDTWRAMEELYEEGKIKAIGVSNFLPKHFEKLMETAKVKPAINQIELHPMLQQNELRAYYGKEGVAIEAYSPLGNGKLLQHPTLVELGQKYGKTSAQVILRWELQNEIITIPKSVHDERIIANDDVWDFELSTEDIAVINGLNEEKRVGTDPEHFFEIFYKGEEKAPYVLSDWEKALDK